MNKKLIKIIEKKVGLSLDEIYQMNPVDIARHIEKKMSKKLTYPSELPFIGRGNVLREGIMDSKSINSEIDRIVGIK
jgi:hypothetical protein